MSKTDDGARSNGPQSAPQHQRSAKPKRLKSPAARAQEIADSAIGQCSVLAELQDLAPELLAADQLDAPIFSCDTALAMACGHGDPKAVKMLLELGANANAPTHYGQSALMEAVKSLSPNDPLHAVEWDLAQACMELVVAAGCDIHHRNQIGQQAINWASWSPKQLAAARWLLVRGANPSAACRDGTTPLHSAAKHGCLETAKLFLDAGADIEALAKSSDQAKLLDPLGLAMKWVVLHKNFELLAFLADAKTFAEEKRAAEELAKELGSEAAPIASSAQATGPRL